MKPKQTDEEILKKAQSILGKKSWEKRKNGKSGSEYMKEVRRKGLQNKILLQKKSKVAEKKLKTK